MSAPIDYSKQVTVGGYLAQRMTHTGLDTFFTVPGDFTLALLDELIAEPKLKMVGCCNELTAGYAADGYCRASGGLGVVVVTYMVGGLSVINAVAGAYSEDLPLLVISGGPNTNDQKEGHRIHHTIGESNLYQSWKCFDSVVEKCFVIKNLHDAPAMIDNAISLALKAQKPVYLEIPCNLALQLLPSPCPMDAMRRSVAASDSASLHACTEHILHLLNLAKRPILVAGNKLRKLNAKDDFILLANALGCGVSQLPGAKGILNEDHEAFLGTYWGEISSNAEVRAAVEDSDLIFYVGCVFSDYTTMGWNNKINLDKSVLIHEHHVNVLTKRYHHVTMNAVLSAVAAKAPRKDQTVVDYNKAKEIRLSSNKKQKIEASSTPTILTVQGIIDTLQHDLIATPSTSFLCETGDSWFIGQKLVLPAQANFFIQMQYGSIGWALGALIGIRLAPKSTQKTVALIGDGSFQVTVEALSTLVRERTKATILLLNNHGYGIEAKIHDGPYNDIQNWNYAQLADIFKDHADGEGNATLPATSRAMGLKVKTMEEFRAAVQKADQFEGVTLIECAIDKQDSTDELVAFGTKISKSNMRV